MPHTGQTQRSYRETFLSSAPGAMHLLLIFFFCQGVYSESTQPPSPVASIATSNSTVSTQPSSPVASSGTSNYTAPKMKERDKPIVSYIGDSVVLECQIQDEPKIWQWYKANGTEKELLNATAEPMKYTVELLQNVTKLTVKMLTKEDAGKYVCRAEYNTTQAFGHVELKVLSFTEPLKPFIAIAAEVVILVTVILLYERHCQRQKKDSETTENGPQMSKLTQEESNGTDGATSTRQRKVEQ